MECTVHGVAKSRTRLSHFHFFTSRAVCGRGRHDSQVRWIPEPGILLLLTICKISSTGDLMEVLNAKDFKQLIKAVEA